MCGILFEQRRIRREHSVEQQRASELHTTTSPSPFWESAVSTPAQSHRMNVEIDNSAGVLLVPSPANLSVSSPAQVVHTQAAQQAEYSAEQAPYIPQHPPYT